MQLRHFGIVLLCVALTGCATTVGQTLRDAGLDQTIVVVGAIDPTLYLQQRGSDAGSLGLQRYRVDRWGLNDVVTEALAAQLKASGFTDVRVEGGWQVRDRLRLTGPYARLNSGQADAQVKRVRDTARQTGADVLVVAHVGVLGDVFYGTSESITGFGIYQFAGSQELQGVTFSALAMTVFDDQANQMAHASDIAHAVRKDTQWLNDLRLSEKQLDDVEPVIIDQHRQLATKLLDEFGF